MLLFLTWNRFLGDVKMKRPNVFVHAGKVTAAIVAVIFSVFLMLNQVNGDGPFPCVVPFSTNGSCVQCIGEGDDGGATKCTLTDISSSCFGAAPAGPMSWCTEFTSNCGGMKIIYPNVFDCGINANGVPLGPCTSDYDQALFMPGMPIWPMGGPQPFCP